VFPSNQKAASVALRLELISVLSVIGQANKTFLNEFQLPAIFVLLLCIKSLFEHLANLKDCLNQYILSTIKKDKNSHIYFCKFAESLARKNDTLS